MAAVETVPLACTVRGCGQSLQQQGAAFGCARGHRFDRARSGYLNLLQPQDRRARGAGDSAAALEARSRLLRSGVGADLLRGYLDTVAGLRPAPGAVVVELGSGAGDVLAALARTIPVVGIGIDLSQVAIERAARRAPHLTWIVANADRRLPVLDGGAHVILSLHGRRNPAECARILRPDGFLVLGLAGDDDLVELREGVQGTGRTRDRVRGALAEHEPSFALVERRALRSRARLEPPALRDLLQGTYRGARRSAAERLNTLTAMEVTLALEIIVLSRR